MASLEQSLGTDIAHISDLKKSASGDFDTIAGLANVKNAIFHRIMTEPGSLIHRPNYGVGLSNFLNGPVTLDRKRLLALRLQEQLMQDPRIEAFLGVGMQSADGTPEQLKVTVRVKIAGYGDTELQLSPFDGGV